MTSQFTDINQGGAGHKLLGDESVAEVVDLGVFDAGELEVAVDARADVPDEERITGFGDKNILGSTFRSFLEIDFEGGLGGAIKGDGPLFVGFVGLDGNFVVS